MNRRTLSGGLGAAFLSLVLAGCGGSASSPTGVSGTVRGTVTRVILPGIPEERPETVRLPSADTKVEVYQSDVLRQTLKSDKDGRFTLSLPGGTYRLTTSDEILANGPATFESKDITVSVGKTVSVNLDITIAAP